MTHFPNNINQPPRCPAHIPLGTGQKPLAQPPTHRANDQARSGRSLQRLGHGLGLVVLQPRVHAGGVHLRLLRDFQIYAGAGLVVTIAKYNSPWFFLSA